MFNFSCDYSPEEDRKRTSFCGNTITAFLAATTIGDSFINNSQLCPDIALTVINIYIYGSVIITRLIKSR
jgi:hypothetical protein